MINLSQEERTRFAAYLEQEAASDEAMAKQALKLPGKMGTIMAQKYRVEALAMRIVAKKFDNTETVTI